MSHDWIEILRTPLPIDRVAAFVCDPQAGGINIFLGTTRAEGNRDGRKLLSLDYEAYTEMALSQLQKLCQTARQRWPIIKIAVLHRTGRVNLAEPSVIIAVSTPHRAESFEASRFLIDGLKKEVTIWKQEVWSDGATSWVHPNP